MSVPPALVVAARQLVAEHGLAPGAALSAAIDAARSLADTGHAGARRTVHQLDLACSRGRAVELASHQVGRSRQHVSGTAYNWKHNYIPINVQTALLHRKKKWADKLHKQGASHAHPEPGWWHKKNPAAKKTLHATSLGKLDDSGGPSQQVKTAKKSGKHVIQADVGKFTAGQVIHARLPDGSIGKVKIEGKGKEFGSTSGGKKQQQYHYTQLEQITHRSPENKVAQKKKAIQATIGQPEQGPVAPAPMPDTSGVVGLGKGAGKPVTPDLIEKAKKGATDLDQPTYVVPFEASLTGFKVSVTKPDAGTPHIAVDADGTVSVRKGTPDQAQDAPPAGSSSEPTALGKAKAKAKATGQTVYVTPGGAVTTTQPTNGAYQVVTPAGNTQYKMATAPIPPGLPAAKAATAAAPPSGAAQAKNDIAGAFADVDSMKIDATIEQAKTGPKLSVNKKDTNQKLAAAFQKAVTTGKPHYTVPGGSVTTTKPQGQSYLEFRPDGTVWTVPVTAAPMKKDPSTVATLVASQLAKKMPPPKATPVPSASATQPSGNSALQDALSQAKASGQTKYIVGGSIKSEPPASGSYISVSPSGSSNYVASADNTSGAAAKASSVAPSTPEPPAPKPAPLPSPAAAPSGSPVSSAQHKKLAAAKVVASKGGNPVYLTSDDSAHMYVGKPPGGADWIKVKPDGSLEKGSSKTGGPGVDVTPDVAPTAKKSTKSPDPKSAEMVDKAELATNPVKASPAYLSENAAQALQKAVATDKPHYVTGSDKSWSVTDTAPPAGQLHYQLRPDGTEWVINGDGSAAQVDPKTVDKHLSGQLQKATPGQTGAYTGMGPSDQGYVTKATVAEMSKNLPDFDDIDTATGLQIAGHYKAIVDTGDLAAMQSYTGNGYAGLNKWLRTGDGGTPQLKQQVKQLDQLMGKYKMPSSVVVHRGIDATYFPKGPFVPGTTFTDHGYVSTSYGSGFGGEIKFTFTVPKGMNAISVDGAGGGSIGTGAEKEIILPRGTRFVVESDKTVGGVRQISAVALPPSDVSLPSAKKFAAGVDSVVEAAPAA